MTGARAWLLSGVGGLLFGVGLVVSGMTDPRNVIGFLDVAGDFRPNLALVMASAVGVHAAFLRFGQARSSPARPSLLPVSRRIDAELVIGAGIFGVGWGLGGYCPGPSIVALGFGRLGPVVVVGATLVGMFVADLVARTLSGAAPSPDPSDAPAGSPW